MASRRGAFTVLGFLLLLGLAFSLLPAGRVTANPDEAKWSRVNTPAEGEDGGWVLAPGTNIQNLAMSPDGVLYACTSPRIASSAIVKSTNGGQTWSPTGQVTDTIVALVAAPENVVAYATTSRVYLSFDAGAGFAMLPPSPGGAGSNNTEITSLALTRLDGANIIAVGTRNNDAGRYGGVHIFDGSSVNWTDTGAGNFDIVGLAFSPEYPRNRQLIAVATDEVDTFVMNRIHGGNWGAMYSNAAIRSLAARKAAVGFPLDYNSTTAGHTFFVGLDAGSEKGDVYTVVGASIPDSSRVTDLNIGSAYGMSGVDTGSLAVSGNTGVARIMAGATNTAQVYTSTDGGAKWSRSVKPPTGQSGACVAAGPDLANRGTAYSATSGTGSAFSRTDDNGQTWNQVGLIDGKVSSITGFAASANYSHDSTAFLLTFDAERLDSSVWRSQNGGAAWERLCTGSSIGAEEIKSVEVSPRYGLGSQVIFLSGTSRGIPSVWRSEDGGQTFRQGIAPFNVEAWAITGDSTLFVCGYDGTNGLISRSVDGGFTYASPATISGQVPKSIALSPEYRTDGNILIGTNNGWVYWSSDNGSSFRRLGQQLPVTGGGTGKVSVAFDPSFSVSKTVYAATNTPSTTSSKERIYRFVIGKSVAWEPVDSALPTGSAVNRVDLSPDGVLYAINSQTINSTAKLGGMERSLNPSSSLSPTFETVTRGLDDGGTLNGLWVRGSQLWSIDTTRARLMTYLDTLTQPPVLLVPEEKATGLETGAVRLDWQVLEGATKYEWQLDTDADFSEVPVDSKGECERSEIALSTLKPTTTYYWRVRAIQPTLSPWSQQRSFTTQLGAAPVTPQLLYPEAGAVNVPNRPIFQWSAMAGATSYELLVSTEPSFTKPVIKKSADTALPATAWQSDIVLEYSVTHYWKVRAWGAGTYSDWSAVGAFSTEAPPPAPEPRTSVAVLPTTVVQPTSPPPAPPATPGNGSRPLLPDWAVYMIVGLLAVLVSLVAALLVFVVRTRKT